jgi:hypothetical protein
MMSPLTPYLASAVIDEHRRKAKQLFVDRSRERIRTFACGRKSERRLRNLTRERSNVMHAWRTRPLRAAGLTLCVLAFAASEASAEPYTLTSKEGWCLDGQQSRYVIRNFCSSPGVQKTWSLEFIGLTWFKMRSSYTGLCAEVVDGSSQGEKITQSPCVNRTGTERDTQRWRALYARTVNGTPYYHLQNYTLFCLDHAPFSWPMYPLDMFTYQRSCTGADNRLWDLYNVKYAYHGP